MDKEIIEVPVLSAAIRNLGIPLSPVIRANGFVFVSGLPPLDLETGKLIRGDITAQTECVLKNVQSQLRLLQSDQRGVRPLFRTAPSGEDLCCSWLLAARVRC